MRKHFSIRFHTIPKKTPDIFEIKISPILAPLLPLLDFQKAFDKIPHRRPDYSGASSENPREGYQVDREAVEG